VLGETTIIVHWYGNYHDNILGTWRPTWLHGKAKQHRHEHSAHRPGNATPLTNVEPLLPEQIIVHGFHLDLSDKVPTPILHIIENHPQVQWQLPTLDDDDVFPRSTAPAIAVPLTAWQPNLLPNGNTIPNSGYRIIADRHCGKGISAYGLTQNKLKQTNGYFATTGPMTTSNTPSNWQTERAIQLKGTRDVYPPDLQGRGLLDLGLYINNADEETKANCTITTLQRCDPDDDASLLRCLSPFLTDINGQRSYARYMLNNIRDLLPTKPVYYGEVKLLQDLPPTQADATFLRWKYNDEGVTGHFTTPSEIKTPPTTSTQTANHRQ
jgi:hypothetical protein